MLFGTGTKWLRNRTVKTKGRYRSFISQSSQLATGPSAAGLLLGRPVEQQCSASHTKRNENLLESERQSIEQANIR